MRRTNPTGTFCERSALERYFKPMEIEHVVRKRRPAVVDWNPAADHSVARSVHASLRTALRLQDDIDFATVNWRELAQQTLDYTHSLRPGVLRTAEMNVALACEALARSRDLSRQPVGTVP
jgi:hypothetical protein